MISSAIATPSASTGLNAHLREAALVLAGGLAFGALAWLSIEMSRGDGRIAAVWVPNAIAVAVLLRVRLKREHVLLASMWTGNVIANTIVGDSPVTAIGLATGNTIEIACALMLMRRWCGQTPDLLDFHQLLRFLLAAAIIAPILSATFATLVLRQDGADILASWLRWSITDGLGMTIIAPAVMIFIDSWRSRHRPSRAHVIQWVVMLALGTLVTAAIFAQSQYPLLFLAGPFVVLHAFRLGALGTAFSVLTVAIIAMAFTSFESGPVNLIEGPMSSKLIVLQAFLASAFLIGLPVAATLAGRRRIMSELARDKHKLNLLANNVTDAILRFDTDGICTYASPSVRAVLSREPEDFLGKRASEKLHDDARDLICEVETALLEGRLDKERFTYRRLRDAENGSPVHIEADCAIIIDTATGERDGFVVSARDVTPRVELERLLIRARRHAEEGERAKSEFLANMSHEIRTPMNGVLGLAELLLQSELDKNQRHHVEMIVQSGRSMMLLLNDILDLSKIEAGHISIDPAPVDLHATLSECAALHRPNAQKKGLQLTFEYAGDGANGAAASDDNQWFVTDGLRVRQIVLNLIGNAVKFTESGRIDVSYRTDGEQFSVAVTDTGIGISKSRLGSIFQPFTQAEGDTTRRFGGTGLGLTISRQLAELLGGYIEVESDPGRGSRFTLTLPAMRAVPASYERLQPEPICLEDLQHDSRILLAEDHDVNRLLVSEMLERCGQRVVVAHDGTEAIAMVIDGEVRGKPFDLVLMDIQMPGCDGYAATRAIRAGGIGPDELPIIALTANAFPEDIIAARKAGMQAHLTKPLAFAELARALQRWLPTRIVEEASGSEGGMHEGRIGPGERDRTAADAAPPRIHSPALVTKWRERRNEAIEAVREAVCNGGLADRNGGNKREPLAQLVHKLAGTAAMFGEAELGERASAFEQALRTDSTNKVQRKLALELLRVADRGIDAEAIPKRA